MGARPEKTKKIKAESKKKNKKNPKESLPSKQKTKESLCSKQKETQRDTTFSSMKRQFMILLYLLSVFVFYISNSAYLLQLISVALNSFS